jgi:hypothetical protein
MWNSCHSSERHDNGNDCRDSGYERRDDCDDRGRWDDHGHGGRHHGWGNDWRGNDCDPGYGDHGHHGHGGHGGHDGHGLIIVCH